MVGRLGIASRRLNPGGQRDHFRNAYRSRNRHLHRAGKDAAGVVAAKALTITTIGSGLTITTASLPPVAQGAAYSQTLTATGGTGGYRWSIGSGALPAGLTLDASGRISGTADGSTSTFSVQVIDSRARR